MFLFMEDKPLAPGRETVRQSMKRLWIPVLVFVIMFYATWREHVLYWSSYKYASMWEALPQVIFGTIWVWAIIEFILSEDER
jgi:hypothetical protein